MGKDPAFLFYPNDWLGGTMGMTLEEKGAYMELLIFQFNRGHMEGHMCGQVVGQIWDKIKDKFKIDDAGRYYNERLEIEKERRIAYSNSRKNNLEGKNQYSKKNKKRGHMTSHMEGHMENENRNENEYVDKGGMGGKGKPSVEEIREYCELRKNQVDPETFFNFYESKGWMIGKNKMKDWKAAVRTWEKNQTNGETKKSRPAIKELPPFPDLTPDQRENNRLLAKEAAKEVLGGKK